MEKVLIVTDHKLMYGTFVKFLEKYSSSISVFNATSYIEVLSLFKRAQYALVIIDMNSKSVNSLELFLTISCKTNTSKILMVNVQTEDVAVFEMYRLGVSGMISVKADGKEFSTAIAAMFENGNYFSPVLAEKMFFCELRYNRLKKHKLLSLREMQVMMMIGAGRRIKEIAEYAYLSNKTISTYKSNVYRKMGFNNDSQLMEYLVENKFL